MSPRAHLLKAIGLRPEIAKKANFMKGKGCSHCNKSAIVDAWASTS